MQYEPHPAAEIFPLMSEDEFAGLVADIQEHGLREPIVLFEGKVLDGRNRARACNQLGIKPATTTWPNSEDPHAYVVSKNLHRRHLSESQRAMVAAKLATMRRGRPQENAQICAKSQAEAAELMGVSRRSVQSARIVQEKGTLEEIAAVEAGGTTVSHVAETVQERTETAPVEDWLAAGKELLNAKAVMTAAALNQVIEEMGHSARDARRLVQIASHPEIGSGEWNRFLPPNLTALSELARLSPEQFKEHMAAGNISPDITKRAARKLAIEARNTAKPPSDATRIAKETGVPQVASDGNIYFGADIDEAQEADSLRDMTYAVIDSVKALSTMPPPEQWVASLKSWRMLEINPDEFRAAYDWLKAIIPLIEDKKNGK